MPQFAPEDETLVECRVCGGKWKLGDHVCKWCTHGAMSKRQLDYWREHKSGLHPAAIVNPPGATGSSQ